MHFLQKIFGDPNEKILKKLRPNIAVINGLEAKYKEMVDEALRGETARFREELAKGKTLDDLLPEAFAAVREAARRTLGQRHYDVQLLGGMTLCGRRIAEMKTGEGKTLVSTLPVYLNALEGKGVHVVTVNDYLTKRDMVWMGQIYDFLGLTVGAIVHEAAFRYDKEHTTKEEDKERDALGSFKIEADFLRPVPRKEAYLCDITYGTNNEFGFDYLRDNMAPRKEQMVQRELHFAIIDEVDSILIDEARTPLIISAPDMESTDLYYKFSDLVRRLEENKDYNIDEKMRAATLTEEGIAKMEKMLGVENMYVDGGGIATLHHMEQALKAQALFKRDKDYVVREGEVLIVDEFTGRLMHGRRYSEGLHQAIEAKEGVKIQRESKTLATITFQNYFRLYDKLAGMTGTAATESEEFYQIYSLEVVSVPTNRPLARADKEDRIYKSEMGKFKAVVEEIKARHEKGQPVLVGTISIEKNEILGDLLAREGIPHNLLNAKNHEREAEIIAQAGRKGAVTIATNMAGRGVDIVLGGNPSTKEEQEEIRKLGGLCVLGTERHESRRIDNQLRGRSGRQGDPGETRFYISLEDDLMRIFGSERLKKMMETLKIPEDMPIENRMISRSIEAAQKKVEGHHFDIRKHLVEYDDVLNKQREAIYRRRREIFDGENLREKIFEMVRKEAEQVVFFHTAHEDSAQWNIQEIFEVVKTIFPLSEEDKKGLLNFRPETQTKEDEARAKDKIIEYVMALAGKKFDEAEEKFADKKILTDIERGILLRSIDELWMEHLDAMSHLRAGIGLRGYGQRDPLVEYKRESHRMYHETLALIQKQVVYSIFKIAFVQEIFASGEPKRNMVFSAPAKTGDAGAVSESATSNSPYDKVGRNDACPCGSGKKYKKCHGV